MNPEISLPDGRQLTICPARAGDALAIRWLYHCVYGGNYPFSLVYNTEECAKAIASDRYLWLLLRAQDKVAGSVIFIVDRSLKLGKVFGGVVAEEFRGFDLMEKMMAFGLERLALKQEARSVYATTRTVSLAPQRLTEKLGFKKLGIFPNAHKVNLSETHTLAVSYDADALKERAGRPRLPALLKGFFDIVRREASLEEAEYLDLPVDSNPPNAAVAFEYLAAPQFILRRFQEAKQEGRLILDFFPFQEPNLLITTADGGAGVYCYRSGKDGHCVLTGARPGNLDLRQLLEHGSRFLEGMGVRYIEVLMPGEAAEDIWQALGAGFLPSAYYPAMRWDKPGGGRDYVVMSRSLAMLHFKGISLQPAYADYLREYFRLWSELYVDKAISGRK